MEVSQEVKEELRWWTSKALQYNGRPIEIPEWDMIIKSKLGWGACTQDVQTGGPSNSNISSSLHPSWGCRHSDHPRRRRLSYSVWTMCSCVLQRPHSPTQSRLAVRIWEWCIQKEMIIHAELRYHTRVHGECGLASVVDGVPTRFRHL